MPVVVPIIISVVELIDCYVIYIKRKHQEHESI